MIATGASLINLAVALILIREGRKNQSITLEADGKHLMTDVVTPAGVLVGIGLVKATGWMVLDPLVAIAVAINIIWTGYVLMRRSARGLIDTAIPEIERDQIRDVLRGFGESGVDYHSLMTRQAGRRKFISFHLLVPQAWNVKKGHDYSEKVENEIRKLFPGTLVTVFVHLEPVEDQTSMLDIGLDR